MTSKTDYILLFLLAILIASLLAIYLTYLERLFRVFLRAKNKTRLCSHMEVPINNNNMKLTISELRKQLKNYRNKYNLSLQEISDSIKVSTATLSRFETGESKTNIRDVIKIYEYFVRNHIKETLIFTIEYKERKKKA